MNNNTTGGEAFTVTLLVKPAPSEAKKKVHPDKRRARKKVQIKKEGLSKKKSERGNHSFEGIHIHNKQKRAVFEKIIQLQGVETLEGAGRERKKVEQFWGGKTKKELGENLKKSIFGEGEAKQRRRASLEGVIRGRRP